jgi:hypothetical protein
MKNRIAFALIAFACAGAMCRNKPAEYGAMLAVCTETSKSWEEYEPCCVEVARMHQRDPSFCLRDGGAE